MFKKVKWGVYAPHPSAVVGDHLPLLGKLITLAFPSCYIDSSSVKAKELLDYDVITITDGKETECYSYDRLVNHLLPYVLFNNNWYFIRAYTRTTIVGGHPINTLKRLVERYYQTIKRQTGFVI